MKTEVQVITPEIARDLLQRNTRNRPIRPGHLERLRASFERGEYVQTHQGLAFATDGTLIDGQHRLQAIAALPDHYSFKMLVSTGLSHDSVFPVVDAIMATRTAADGLGMDRKLVEVGAFFCRIHISTGSASMTPTRIRPYVELVSDTTSELMAFCNSSAKTWGSATVRAAAVYNMMRGIDGDYVKLMYRAMCLADFPLMTPVCTSLFRSNLSGKVRASERYDLFVRCVKAYDPKHAAMVKIQISDQAVEIAKVRAWIETQFSRPQLHKLRAVRGVD
jgi:hypothetical protein